MPKSTEASSTKSSTFSGKAASLKKSVKKGTKVIAQPFKKLKTSLSTLRSKSPLSHSQSTATGLTTGRNTPINLDQSDRWWASSSDTLIYPSIFAFPSLSLHRWSTTMHLRSNATTWQSHSLYWTDLAYLMDIWLTIHMYLLLFLVSPMCPLLWSDQSRGLTPRGQALSIASPYARILVYHSYLTCLYLPFATEHHYWSPNQLPIWVSPRIEISHYFALFRIASHCHDPTISTCHNTPGDNPLPPDRTPSEPHRIYT